MASEIFVKLSEMDRPSKPVNDSDVVFIAQNEAGITESKAMEISDLRSLLNFENAFTTTVAGLAGTVPNQIFYVYVDAEKTTVKAYVNRNGVAEQIFNSDGTAKINYTGYGIKVIRGDVDGIMSNNGADEVGYQRKEIELSAESAAKALNSLPINIWEFSSLVTKKDNPNDPSTWDWSPAVSAAIDKCIYQKEINISNAQRYASGWLFFPPGKYRLDSKIVKDLSAITYETGKPRFRILGKGAYISSNVNKDFLFTFTGGRLEMDGLTFIKEPGIFAYYIKLGSEVTANSMAVGGRFSNLNFMSPTKALTFGQCYDAVFDCIYMTGFVAVDDNDTNNPATGIHFLPQATDNSNNIVFIRPHIETTYTKNYVAIKVDPTPTSSTHHNIKFEGGHIETHFYGAKWFNLGGGTQFNFDTVIFTDNGSGGTDSAGTYELGFINQGIIKFTGCTFQTLRKSAVGYDSAVHVPMIRFGTSTNTGRVFDSCYFSSAFSEVSGNSTVAPIFDVSASTQGKRAYQLINCAINNFTRRITSGLIINDVKVATRKFIIDVDSDNNSALSIYYTNTDGAFNPTTPILSVAQDGTISGYLIKTTASISSGNILQIGNNNTTSGDRRLDFYPYGNTTLGGRILLGNTGPMTITSYLSGMNFVANGGASQFNFMGAVVPNATNLYDFGTSALQWRDGYFSRAITVAGNPVGVKVTVPANATAPGTVGQWAADSSYYYVCIATNTWVRAALSSW